MFKETDNGQTQYCPMCEEWAKKYEKLKVENKKLKNNRKIILGNGSIISKLCSQYRKVLEEVREITNNFFEECGIPDDYFKRNNYSWKQHQIKALTCKIKQIQDKINEVLKDEY